MLDDNMGLQYLAPIALPWGMGCGGKVEFLRWNSQKKIQRKKDLTPN